MEKEGRQNMEDDQLLAQLQLGHLWAFKALFQRYHGRVMLVAFRYVQDENQAQDIAQEVWMKILAFRNQTDKPLVNNFRAYLFQMIKHKSLDYLKSRGRTRIRKEYHEILPTLSTSSNFLAKLENQDILKKAMEKLSGLPPLQAKVFWLRVIENYSYEAIALQLKITERAAEGQVRRAKERLRKYRENGFMEF